MVSRITAARVMTARPCSEREPNISGTYVQSPISRLIHTVGFGLTNWTGAALYALPVRVAT
jgi:hypothetical protein